MLIEKYILFIMLIFWERKNIVNRCFWFWSVVELLFINVYKVLLFGSLYENVFYEI